MGSDQFSLANLREIVVPDAPSLWPPAPGLWLAVGIVVAVVGLLGWHWYSARGRNAYRRAGLQELGRADSAYDVSVIVKRVALAAFPREQVASLYGDEWAAFLHNTCPRTYFSGLTERGDQAENIDEIVGLAATWIRHHRVAVS